MPRHRFNIQPRLECLEDRAVPATFTVNTTLDEVFAGDGRLSLREAITRANNHPGADMIVLPAGVYKLAFNEGDSGGGGEDGKTNDFDLDITDSLAIRGGGAGRTIIDGQQLDRVFDVFGTTPSSIKVALQSLTVRNGSVSGHAGGIQVGNADLVIRDCVVTGNRSTRNGGGISNEDAPGTGNVKLVSSTLSRNVTGGRGGGVFLLGNPGSVLTVISSKVRLNISAGPGGGINATIATLTNSTVSDNYMAVGNGGGIFAQTVTLTHCTVSGNSAGSNGGGIYASIMTLSSCTISGNSCGAFSGGGGIAGDTAMMANCTVSGNTATAGNGGGIRVNTATLTNCTVSDNTAGGDGGGGIYAGTMTLTNCTVSGNLAPIGSGGGVFAATGSLLNCTIVENRGHIGGGAFQNPGGTFGIKNTIVALNLVDFAGSAPDVSGFFLSQGHNLIGEAASEAGFSNGVNGDLVGTSTNSLDPKLGPLADNGGPTKTHKLLAGSLAIDHGDNANLPPIDQRRFARRRDGNGDGVAVADIGAFER